MLPWQHNFLAFYHFFQAKLSLGFKKAESEHDAQCHTVTQISDESMSSRIAVSCHLHTHTHTQGTDSVSKSSADSSLITSVVLLLIPVCANASFV